MMEVPSLYLWVSHRFHHRASMKKKKQIWNQDLIVFHLMQGDSGGPLMVYEAGQYYVMGLVSFGVRCGSPGFPGIYSRVTHHMDWILSKIVR